MSLIQRFKNRTLRVDILAIFLFLIAFSSLLIISFTYSRNSKSLMKFSDGVIERAASGIVDRMNEFFNTVDRVAENAVSLIPAPQYFSLDDARLASYMVSVVSIHPMFYGIFYSNQVGDFFEVFNVEATGQTHLITNSNEPLPKDAVFAFRTIKQGVYEIWAYKNDKLETVATESIPDISNPLVRPWYIGAVKTKKLFWSPVHQFIPSNKPGITASKANFSSDGSPIAIVGLDLSLNLLSKFIKQQIIGKSGKAYILNSTGKVVVPDGEGSQLVEAAYQKYTQQKNNDFIFDLANVDYLASIHELSFTKDIGWVVLVVVPVNDFFADLFKTQQQVVLISLAILFLSALLVVYFSKRISGPIVALAQETDKIRHLDFESEKRIKSNIREIKIMDAAIAALRVAMHSFGRYIPKEIVRQLIQKEQVIALGGEKKEIVVFFSDIEGFTTMANTHAVEELMPLLTEYLDALSRVILENRGNIDKFVGDGIMAIWGAPLDNPQSAFDACIAALFCQDCATKLNRKFQSENKPSFNTRIGIEMGDAIAGNIGTLERMNYTVIGDAVNIAARLQVTNKIYHTKIIISEHLNQKISEKFLTRLLDIVELRGKKEKIKVYELMAVLQGPESVCATPEQIELKNLFTEALDAYYGRDLGKAKVLFLALQQKFPDDYPTQFYLDRLKVDLPL